MEASMSLFQSLGSVGPDKLHELVNDCNETEGPSPCPHLSSGEHAPTEEAGHDANAIATGRLESGCMQYGCSHYRRKCRIRAPCCNEVFDCRHCHNEAKSGGQNSIKAGRMHRHDLPRHQVQQVICSRCDTEQEVRQFCINCGICMGKYFCETCKFFDDDAKEETDVRLNLADMVVLIAFLDPSTGCKVFPSPVSKKQYHCYGCGICRIGGRENFFHCYKCGCCYPILLRQSHPCIEGAMHRDCPVCIEYLFESTDEVDILPCGHTIHMNCLKKMQQHLQYACPLCSKSVCDMSKVWEKFDIEIAATPMPESYQKKMVWILCNDCGVTSQVKFHVVAQKCLNCKSYNTRQTRENSR